MNIEASFLKCYPSVNVIGDEYEILFHVRERGLCYVKIKDTLYYEDNSGVLPSEKTVVKVRVPMAELDLAREYEIYFRASKDRKAYFSLFGTLLCEHFEFRPLVKTQDIHVYHIADVHYKFDIALKTASYFGDDVDLFVVNGDIGEVETEEDFFKVTKFVGEISKGACPVIFVRGNHDTRGHLAEKFTDYFPADGKKTYYTFSVGALQGVVYDCGEDKPDDGHEYDSTPDTPTEFLGTNRFSGYRQKQLSFLRSLSFSKEGRVTFAIGHICPNMTTFHKGDQFDIERECYTAWTAELERLGIDFMLCGHYHRAFLLLEGDERNIVPHSYPVVVGSECPHDDLIGAAMIIGSDGMEILYTDSSHNIRERHKISFVR